MIMLVTSKEEIDRTSSAPFVFFALFFGWILCSVLGFYLIAKCGEREGEWRVLYCCSSCRKLLAIVPAVEAPGINPGGKMCMY